MTRIAKAPDPRPLLDIGSYARRGPTSAPLSRGEIEPIARTVRRTPEVMVKVLSRGEGGPKGRPRIWAISGARARSLSRPMTGGRSRERRPWEIS
jgi:hypothetical protein